MIIFSKLKYKNFLSTGDSFTQIDLNKSASTLVVGQNGAGKSTMLDALSFALFGKAHRSVSKGQLVNSVNNKNCVVEVEFTALGSEYKIVRGIKPTKFEIWRDEKVINQDSHSKEYQKVLEQNILKLNHKSFHQIIVLGSSSFVPFMQLPANHRREVIEDLLDINVFSKMNVVLKEKFSVIKEKVRANQSDLENLEYKIRTQTKYVESLEKNKRDNRNEKLNEITTLESEIESIRSIMTPVDGDSLHVLKTEHDSCNSLMIQIKQYDKTFNSKLKELDKEKKFYEDNSSCPTCEQGIETTFKEKKISEAETKHEHFTDARSKASEELGKLTGRMVGVVEETRKLQDMIAEQDRKQVEIGQLQKQITTIQQYLAKQDETTTDIAEERKTLSAQNDDREILRDIKGDLAESVAYSMVITELLKDTGIKTKIVKEYLPVINQLVNKYLQVLDFFVSFNLDEQFKETIRSRHRDAFSYDSFSEGEKQRIDLALLFTWRQIAKMKNSVATNLLILDETFDSSLDVEGIDNLTSILDTLDGDTNTYVISHKGELLDGKFEDKIEFIKKGNFSTVHDA
jgi:DNA repair exonuclease SbcCD ATPase subunit